MCRHVDTGFELIADLVQRPRFEEPDFIRVRDLRLNRLAVTDGLTGLFKRG